MNRELARACATVALIIGASAALGAQEPSRTPAAAQATPAQIPPPAAPAPPAPPARKWHGSFSGGIALATGVQAQRGHNVDANLTRPISTRAQFLATASREYQRITFPTPSLVADRLSAAVGADVNVTKHTVAMARSMYLTDELFHVDYRIEELVGYGVYLFDAKKRYQLYLIPGVSVFKQDLTYSDILDWETGVGFYQKFVGKFTDTWSVEQAFRFRDNVSDDDKSIESNASLQGMFTKTLGLQLAYQFNYETIVPPGFPHYLQIIRVGLRFQF